MRFERTIYKTKYQTYCEEKGITKDDVIKSLSRGESFSSNVKVDPLMFVRYMAGSVAKKPNLPEKYIEAAILLFDGAEDWFTENNEIMWDEVKESFTIVKTMVFD